MTGFASQGISQYSPAGGVEETTGGVGEVKPSARVWAPPAAASGAVEEGTVAGTRGAGADAEVAGRGGEREGQKMYGGAPLYRRPLTRSEGGMERGEALGLKSGKNPSQVGRGNTVGEEGERQQETERQGKDDTVKEKDRKRKTEKGQDKGHREKTGRGRKC